MPVGKTIRDFFRTSTFLEGKHTVVNPRRACTGVTCVRVCRSVTALTASLHPRTPATNFTGFS